jgi:predicted HTH domain antitoxin
MVEEQVTISARIQRSLAEEVERLATKRSVDRSTILRELLANALKELRLKEAIELVRKREATVWRAAEMAGVTYREMLEQLKTSNIPFPLSEEELRREIEEIFNRQ